MTQEWDWQSVADWVVQACWEQITGPKPQTEAWLQKSNKRPDGLSWEDVLEAVKLLEYSRWIDFENYNYALSRELISSVNCISFTDKAIRQINGQIEDNPDLPIKFAG